MKTIIKFPILLCILLACQQNLVAQSSQLGKHKYSFTYESLYKNSSAAKIITVQDNSQIKQDNSHIKEEMASAEDIEKMERLDTQIEKLLDVLRSERFYAGKEYVIYHEIYNSLPYTKENVQILIKIQGVLLSFYNTRGEQCPDLVDKLKNTSSFDEQIQIFLSYYK